MFGLGSSSQLGIGIAIKLNDEFSGTAQKVNDQLKQIKANSLSAASSAVSSYRNSSAMIAGGAALVTGAMISAAKSGAEFQHSINQIYIVGGKSLGRTKEQLSDFAQHMSKTFAVSPEDIAKSMFDNVTAGVTKNLDVITKYQLAVAQAANEPLGRSGGTAQTLIAVMNAYDMSSSKVGDVANALTAVGNASLSTVGEIGHALEYAAFTAKQFNVPLNETLAMLGKLSNAGIKGSSAGTGLSNMMMQFGDALGPFATKQQLAAFKMLGLNRSREKSMADHGNFFGVIKDIEAATKGVSPSDKESILKRLFNRRGLRAAEGMFTSKNGNTSTEDLLKAAQEGIKSDVAITQSHKMQQDLASDFIFLHNAMTRFKISFSQSIEPFLRVLIHGAVKIMDVISAIAKNPIGKVLVDIAFVGAGVVTLMFGLQAAILATTIAFKGFGEGQAVGGFGGMLKTGLGLAGMGRFGGNRVARNAAGSLTVPKGSMFAAASGLEQTGGQIISEANLAAVGLGRSGGTKIVKAAEEGTQFFGKGLGFLGESAGALLDILPVIGEIAMAATVLYSLYDLLKPAPQKPRQDPWASAYYQNLDAAYYGQSNSKQWYQNHQGQSRHDGSATQINQNINVNIDGQSTMQKTVNDNMDNILKHGLDNINLNLKH